MSSVEVLLASNPSGLTMLVELCKDFALDVGILEDRLHDEIRVGQLAPILGEGDRLAALPRLFLRQPPFLHLIHEHAHHGLTRFVDRLFVRIHDHDRDTGLGKGDRDAAAHRARPNHTGLRNRQRPSTKFIPSAVEGLRMTWRRLKAGNLVQLALREENVAQRERRFRANEFVEKPRLTRDTERKRQLDRGLHRVDQFVRGETAVLFRRHHLMRLRDDEGRGLHRNVRRNRRFERRDAPLRWNLVR